MSSSSTGARERSLAAAPPEVCKVARKHACPHGETSGQVEAVLAHILLSPIFGPLMRAGTDTRIVGRALRPGRVQRR